MTEQSQQDPALSRTLHFQRAFAYADVRDAEGRVLSTASNTCLIINPDPAR